MYEPTKADWKLYREKVPEWQESYMEKLNQSYIKLLSGKGDASDKFWKLAERINRDKKKPGVLIEMRKSEMIFDVLRFLNDEVITLDDLDGFSAEFREGVEFLLDRRYGRLD